MDKRLMITLAFVLISVILIAFTLKIDDWRAKMQFSCSEDVKEWACQPVCKINGQEVKNYSAGYPGYLNLSELAPNAPVE